MAPINKKIRAVIKSYNPNAENSTVNSPTSPTSSIVTTSASNGSNHTAVITTASSSSSSSSSSGTQGGQSSDSNNVGSSDSDQTEGNSSNSGTPQSDESAPNVTRDQDYPNLSFVGRPKRSTSILSPLSVSSQFGKLLHSVSQRRENHFNVNINNQCIVRSPAISPFDSHSQPFSYSASSSSSSLSPSPSTSIQDKFMRSPDSPSSVISYEAGNRRQSVISGGDRSSPINTSKRETHDESSNEQHHAFNLHNPHRLTSRTTDSNSSSGQSGKITIDKSSEEYRMRRERNNIAVRKSRSKSKTKFLETIKRMNQLEEENSKLHHHIATMSQELAVLKFLLEKYQDENYKRIMKLDNVDAMEIPPEIRMIDRVGEFNFQVLPTNLFRASSSSNRHHC